MISERWEKPVPFTLGTGFAWLSSPPKVMTQRMAPSETFPQTFTQLLRLVPGAEVLAQVGREHRVALRSEAAPARVHLAQLSCTWEITKGSAGSRQPGDHRLGPL